MKTVLIYVAADEQSPAEGPLEYSGGPELIQRSSQGKEIYRFPVWRVAEWLKSIQSRCDNTRAKAGSRNSPTFHSGMGLYARSDSAESEPFPRASGVSS